ncbi:MAG: hypothetical protein P9F75_08825 [Candidatus Contendobacter sp.]|nr:hypothetical protein [Candidatus Contendobacter sp.]
MHVANFTIPTPLDTLRQRRALLDHYRSRPPLPPRSPSRWEKVHKVTDLVREWHAASPEQRRIFSNNIAEFINAHKWVRG